MCKRVWRKHLRVHRSSCMLENEASLQRARHVLYCKWWCCESKDKLPIIGWTTAITNQHLTISTLLQDPNQLRMKVFVCCAHLTDGISQVLEWPECSFCHAIGQNFVIVLLLRNIHGLKRIFGGLRNKVVVVRPGSKFFCWECHESLVQFSKPSVLPWICKTSKIRHTG